MTNEKPEIEAPETLQLCLLQRILEPRRRNRHYALCTGACDKQVGSLLLHKHHEAPARLAGYCSRLLSKPEQACNLTQGMSPRRMGRLVVKVVSYKTSIYGKDGSRCTFRDTDTEHEG